MPFSLSLMSYELTIVRDDELCQQEIEKKNDFWSSFSYSLSSCLSFFSLCCCFSWHIIFPHCAANQESIFLRLRVQLQRIWRCLYKKKKETCETILYLHWLFRQVGSFILQLLISSFTTTFPVVMTTVELFLIHNRLLPANMHAFTHDYMCPTSSK